MQGITAVPHCQDGNKSAKAVVIDSNDLFREETMKKTLQSNAMKSTLCNLLLVTGSIFVATNGAAAKEHKQKTPSSESQVVAHISFDGQASLDMAMQKGTDDKVYLYVQHSKDTGISIVDVTQPAKPKILGVISWPNPAVANQMNVTGHLGIITESAAVPHPDKTFPDLVLWDLSNPVSPRVVQRFSGVVRWFEDERDFIYLLNNDGLWVISNPVDRQPEQVYSSDLGG